MAEVVRYVDRDTNGGGSAGGESWADAYPTLDAWQTAEATDLVTDTDTHIVHYRASTSQRSTAFTFSGWTTSADYYVSVIVPEASRHNLQVDNGTRIEGSVSDGLLVDIPAHTRIIGLALLHSTTSTANMIRTGSSGSDIVFDSMLLTLMGGTGRVIDIGSAMTGLTIQNSVILYRGGRNAIRTNGVAGFIFNSVVYSTASGYDAITSNNATMTVRGTYAYGDDAYGDYWMDVDDSHSNDGSESSTTTTLANAGFTSTTSGSEDFRLTSDSDLIGESSDTSQNANWVGDWVDALGTERPEGAAADIGAHEYVAAASGGSVTLPHYSYGDGA